MRRMSIMIRCFVSFMRPMDSYSPELFDTMLITDHNVYNQPTRE